MQTKINEVSHDIQTLMAQESPFEETVIEKYVATLSVEEAKAKQEELMLAASKAGLCQSKENSPVVPETQKEIIIDSEDGILVKMYGSKNQITQMMDFAKAIGVKIVIQQVS